MRISADHPGKINTKFSFTREADATSSAKPAMDGSAVITLAGQLSAQYVDAAKKPWGPVKPGMRFAGVARIFPTGGSATPVNDRDVEVRSADAVTILITAATDYNHDGTLSGEDPATRCVGDMAKAVGKTFDQLRAAH